MKNKQEFIIRPNQEFDFEESKVLFKILNKSKSKKKVTIIIE